MSSANVLTAVQIFGTAEGNYAKTGCDYAKTANIKGDFDIVRIAMQSAAADIMCSNNNQIPRYRV